MLDALDTVSAVVTAAAVSPWVFLLVFLVCALDGFFPPVPGETVVVAAAAIAWSTGAPSLPLLVVATVAGAWAGDLIAYRIGRRLGDEPFRWMRRDGVRRVRARVDAQLATRPASVLLTGRFLPVARVLVNMAAGTAHVPARRYLPISLAAASAWTAWTIGLAGLAGLLLPSSPLLTAALAVVLAVGAGYAIDRTAARRRARARHAPTPTSPAPTAR
ncbi:DedA family protein [Labedella endophytica]|uniref:DedA family protein n=1 Tax=Labedella endophytica TaxID=1523160 RepID=A0A433JMT0_9MICO|nr:VTT domain-containing protein [Labedella endophytica]RUQ96908.1 DedA family protein [Labedella endophytica]